MIVVEPEFGPVGEWQYLDLSAEVDRRDIQDLRELFRRCQQAAEVLARERLLFCNQVGFTWPGRRIEAPLSSAPNQLADACERAFSARVVPFVYPQTVELTGYGLVDIPERGEEHAANAAWISATSFGHHDVTIMTQIDAWMPFALDGSAQKELAELNAPRLERALAAIREAFGIEPEVEDGTKFANHAGLRLVNQFDSAGAAVDCTTLFR